MDSIGAEVGQKMRSAIKAKLMELDCYVDDELPDYIMVMVANRRTKSQMNEDLNLFLSTKTSTFVNWLHIVLKKLKEVTVTNPEVYKKATKRKSTEVLPDNKNNLNVKKEKSKKVKNEIEAERIGDENEGEEGHSITDDLPVSANRLTENRKVVLTIGNSNPDAPDHIADDSFDIPLLSEVNDSVNEHELQEIEKKIRSVKSRLGLLVESDNEEELSNPNSENGEVSGNGPIKNERNPLSDVRKISILDSEIAGSESVNVQKPSSTTNSFAQTREVELEKYESDQDFTPPSTPPIEKEKERPQHKRITFENDAEPLSVRTRLDRPLNRGSSSRDRFRGTSREKSPIMNGPSKKTSILERLGKRIEGPDRMRSADYRQREDRPSEYKSADSTRRRSLSRDRQRLGRDRQKRNSSRNRHHSRSRSRDRSLRSSEKIREKESKKEGILSRLGVQSKVAVVKRPPTPSKSDEEEEKIFREVLSSIKVKPRVIPSHVAQPNKNLLLKAVAEAHRSIAQTPKVGKEIKLDSVYVKKYSEKYAAGSSRTPEKDEKVPRKRADQGKNKLKEIIRQSSSRMRSRLEMSSDDDESDREYVPSPVKKVERDVPSYVPSSKSGSETESKENDQNPTKQQFIITLDGIDKLGFMDIKTPSVKSSLENSSERRLPSPIVFDKSKRLSSEKQTTSRQNIPDKLPVVHPPLSVKNKERCRFWPGCRQGDKCEFVHPSENCGTFPQCRYGDKCLFLHPKCKFGSSCTKRDCPYDHTTSSSGMSSTSVSPVKNCKFFPNCVNTKCPFLHPKPCIYGKYCKNMSECTFSHALVVSKKNLSWRSK